MYFNSLEFLVFFAGVYSLYISLGHRGQNRMLLLASYVFYGWWDWRFLSLLWLSTLVDFFCGIKMYENGCERVRKRYMTLSVLFNLSLLGIFKYFDFFTESFVRLLGTFGWHVEPWSLGVILPVGISFYTFQTMSYTLDIYRKQLKPTYAFLDFALFVAFFPQLVAGPIERARRLLPQITSPRKLQAQQLREGTFLFCWGMFMKVMIADNLAPIVNRVFALSASGDLHPETTNFGYVMLAVYSFAIQIYCDFAGYSMIARGLAKWMGFELMVNFKVPFLARRLSEFWAQWHISLTSWVRDYVYMPLGASHRNKTKTNLAIILTMTLIGLWHGASWNFVLWGLFYGLIQAGYNLIRPFLKKTIQPQTVFWSRVWVLTSMALTFHIFFLSGFLFRAQSLHHTHLLLTALTHAPVPDAEFMGSLVRVMYVAAPFWAMQIWQYRTGDMMCLLKAHPYIRFICYLVALYIILFSYLFGVDIHGGEEFIYFQF